MFETAAIPYGHASNRMWTTCMGMTGQAAAVAIAILVPLVSPSVLPRVESFIGIEAPAPLSRPETRVEGIRVERVARPEFQMRGEHTVMEPGRVPDEVVRIVEGPLPPGAERFNLRPIEANFGDWVKEMLRPADPTPRTAAAPPKVVPVEPAAPPKRVKSGGLVQPAVVIERVEPVYPALAIQTHTSGVVVLEAVIGVEGRVRDLRLVSGHPLLVKAAMDAVRQWVYTPTLLNGDPVEIVQQVNVTFRLK